MDSAKRRIANMRCLRGAAHESARTCARLLFTVTDRTATHRKLDQRRDGLCAGGLRKRADRYLPLPGSFYANPRNLTPAFLQ